MEYLDNLNTSQRMAVTAPLGPVSVLAGPGSGKTRVLTNRIQHLFYNHNLIPSRIRAVTFTQNGTQTMRERLNGDGVRDVRISTFHSLCRSIIDDHYQQELELVALCEAAGVLMPFCWHSFQPKDKQPHLDWYKTNGKLTLDVAIWIAFQYACVAFSQRIPPELDFTSEGYQRVLWTFEDIKRRLRPVHGFVNEGMPELTLLGNYEGLCEFRNYVQAVFGYELQVADELHPDYRYMVSNFSDNDPLLESHFIDAYHQLAARYVFLDFASQTLWAHRIILSSPKALRSLQSRYSALLIDEFQDTDPVQFDIAQRIVAKHKNIFVVGDHNQAIYGFRGADAENLNRFRETFPETHEVLLDKNYRSTPEIVEVSRAVVEKFQDPNYIFPSAVNGSGAVVTAIEEITDVQISDPAELLVLSYTNRAVQMNCYALKAMGIPYVRTVRFAEDGEKRVFCVRKPIVDRILDITAFLREPSRENTLAAAAYLNGIGKKAQADLALLHDLTLESRLEPLFDFRDQIHPLTLASQVQNIGNKSGKSPKGEYGIFKASSINWHSDSVGSDISFLGRVLTRYDHIPTYEELVESSAQVMTVHQAKGMEAPIVIVDGYSFFPSRGRGSEESTYEMARVMYVALSRAERELYLITDWRDFPNMQGVYETIDRQAETE
ncbi:ATP-dependent helicase [Candidatus Poribacteria bacterium]|nr:ATP-dependent helicase [Candidatus Poribacteria bacterium]